MTLNNEATLDDISLLWRQCNDAQQWSNPGSYKQMRGVNLQEALNTIKI